MNVYLPVLPPKTLSALDRARTVASRLSDAAEAADGSASIDQGTWETIHSTGLAMAPFPARYGGDDLTSSQNHAELFAILRLIGAADLSIGRLFEGHVNAVALACRYGTTTQVEALAEAASTGGFSAVWGADDSSGLRIEAHDGAWRLRGRKILASGAGFITRPIVTAKGEAGQVMVMPRLGQGERADTREWTAQGMRSTATGSIDLSGMMLDGGQILGQPGDFMRQPWFSGGAWRFCAVHLGATEQLLDLFREHLVSRGRAQDPYQMQRVAHCTAATTTAAFWIADAARRLAEETADPRKTVAFVNLTRMVTERAALDVLECVHRGVGLSAFLRPHPIERISRDLATYLRQPVPDLAMTDAAQTILASQRSTAELWASSHEG